MTRVIANGVEHQTTRDHGGEGMSGWIRPKCTCGWVGRAEYAYEDYQHTSVSDQEGRHIRSTEWWKTPEVSQQGDSQNGGA